MQLIRTLVSLAVVTGVFAAPSPAKEWVSRPEVSKSHLGQSHRMIPARRPKSHSGLAGGNEDDQADIYTYNWSGAIKYADSGELITSVAATFTMPNPSIPTNQPAGDYSGAAWVGLGGATANTSLWQAGGVWDVVNTQSPTSHVFSVWYEWLPNGLIKVPNFPTGAGHVIEVHLNADRPGTGAVIIKDKTSGQTTSITTQAPNPTATLSGATAEWITEDLSGGNGLLPYANYHKIKYTKCAYGNYGGSKGNLSNVTLVQGVNSAGQINSQASQVSASQLVTVFVAGSS